eukprot:6374068-Prymnesium_polylepis.1
MATNMHAHNEHPCAQIQANKIGHPLVKKAFNAMRTAPASYKLPSADRLAYDLLESTTAKLQAEEKPVRMTKRVNEIILS